MSLLRCQSLWLCLTCGTHWFGAVEDSPRHHKPFDAEHVVVEPTHVRFDELGRVTHGQFESVGSYVTGGEELDLSKYFVGRCWQ